MGLKTVQECDYCGEMRVLQRRGQSKEHESPETGGWRELNAGGKSATFCSACVRRMVEEAVLRKEARDAQEER